MVLAAAASSFALWIICSPIFEQSSLEMSPVRYHTNAFGPRDDLRLYHDAREGASRGFLNGTPLRSLRIPIKHPSITSRKVGELLSIQTQGSPAGICRFHLDSFRRFSNFSTP